MTCGENIYYIENSYFTRIIMLLIISVGNNIITVVFIIIV